MKKIKILLLFILPLTISGCTGGTGEEIQNNFNNMRIAYGEDRTSAVSFTSRAKMLKDVLMKIEGISDAKVVITGHTALIGIVVNTDDTEELARVKKEAGKIAKQTDSGIYHTAITSNQEIIDMIEEMEEEKES